MQRQEVVSQPTMGVAKVFGGDSVSKKVLEVFVGELEGVAGHGHTGLERSTDSARDRGRDSESSGKRVK
jgi:hypothetical protein